jgi:60 kDa SS-A/Ro ribonucleoprotein
MAQNFTKHFSTRTTAVADPIPGREKEMHKNAAGGYTFTLDDWKYLDRFLFIGTEGGTYYVGEKKLTFKAAKNVWNLIHTDYKRVVDRVVAVSHGGLAPKNDTALFIMAMAASAEARGALNAEKAQEARKYALDNLHLVARYGTDLFNFAEYVKAFRGWGPGLRKALSRWYTHRSADSAAYQITKYRQRNGWTHRDILRIAHPKVDDGPLNNVLNYAVNGYSSDLEYPSIIEGYEKARSVTTAKEWVKLIQEHKLTWEMLPTEALNHKSVWDALLVHMPLGATIRNLGKMTSIGLLAPMSDASMLVATRLQDQEYLRKSRIHPIGVLSALAIYDQGHGAKGNLKWNTTPAISEALDNAFYLAFGNIEPIGKKTIVALDVSGSMSCPAMGMPHLTNAQVAAAMAMAVVRSEDSNTCYTFGFANDFRDLKISKSDSLESVLRKTDCWNFGGTDASVPARWAYRNQIPVELILVYTDNETWIGKHPTNELKKLREKMGIDTRLVSVGISATNSTIADPKDPRQLDVCGFDLSVPNTVSNFAKGEF